MILAIIFLMVSFYNIDNIAEINYLGFPREITFKDFFEYSFQYRTHFIEFFERTWHNYAISGLFALLGVLEIKEGVTNGN